MIYYALLGRDETAGPDGLHMKAYRGLKNNAPEWAPELMDATAKRKALDQLGRQVPNWISVDDIPLVAIPTPAVEAIERWLCKLTCALAYKELKIIPSPKAVYWSMARPQAHLTVHELFSMLPYEIENFVRPTVQRRFVDDIFRYAWTVANDTSCFSAVYQIGSAMCGIGSCIFEPDPTIDDGHWMNAFGEPASSSTLGTEII